MFSSRSLVAAFPREMHPLFTQLEAPSVTLVWGPPGDDEALEALAQLAADGEVPTEGLRYGVWVRTASSTHTSAQADFLDFF